MDTLRTKNLVGKRGDWIDDESFQRIYDDVCHWFDRNIDRVVNNIQQVYAMTGNETGYSTLVTDWPRRRQWKGVGDVQRFSDEEIRANIIEKMYAPLCWLWQQNEYGNTEFVQGFTGLLVTFHLEVNKGDKSDEFRWSYSYNLSLNIGSGEHGAIK